MPTAVPGSQIIISFFGARLGTLVLSQIHCKMSSQAPLVSRCLDSHSLWPNSTRGGHRATG